jgi:putative transposase
MARRQILFSPDRYYHLYNRGNNKGKIFLDDENYFYFLKKMNEYFGKAGIEIIAYCLMPNHYHVLAHLPRITRFPIYSKFNPVKNRKSGKKISEIPPEIYSNNFSNVIRSFTISYSKSFNSWNKRTGHVFQGNFQAREIVDLNTLVLVCRYIHLNPVRAGLASKPDEWIYSDYSKWISDVSTDESPNIKARNLWFRTGKEYKSFVDDYAGDQKSREEIIKMLFST